MSVQIILFPSEPLFQKGGNLRGVSHPGSPSSKSFISCNLTCYTTIRRISSIAFFPFLRQRECRTPCHSIPRCRTRHRAPCKWDSVRILRGRRGRVWHRVQSSCTCPNSWCCLLQVVTYDKKMRILFYAFCVVGSMLNYAVFSGICYK